MEIVYKVHDNLYVNLTNKCPCSCTFCLRQTRDHMENSGTLWLEHEPTTEEIIAEFENFDMNKYSELVFCGFGEPTERIDVLLEIAKYAKDKFNIKTRINTNGLGNLVNQKDITASLSGLIDTVSISLNTPNKERYFELTRSIFGIESFDAMIDFARKATEYVPNVVMTTVATTITREEENECQKICDEIGAQYRIRPWED